MKKGKIFLALALAFCGAVKAQTLKDAIKLTEQELFDKADKQYEALLASSQGADVYYYQGLNAYRSENFVKADMLFKKGLEKDPANALCLIGTGRMLWEEGKTAEAKANFDKALAGPNAKVVNLNLTLAEVYITSDKKDLPAAKLLLDNALKLDPKNPEVFLLTGDYFIESNDGNKAIENYKRAHELDKTSVKALLRQGQLYGRSKNYNLALDYYRQAANIDSSFAPAYREQGELYYLAKKYENAKYNYKKYLDLTGGTISGKTRYAQFLFLSKDYKKAVEEISALQSVDTSRNVMNRLIGYSYYETGEYAKALAGMNKFFARAPQEKNKVLASDYEYMGKIYNKLGKDSLAIANINRAMSMDTAATQLYGELGSIYQKQKNYTLAVENYKKKIAAGKDVNVNDYFNIGRNYYFLKDYVNADTSFSTVIAKAPKMIIGYFWKARAKSAQDPDSKGGLAKPFYEKVVEIGSADAVKNKNELIEAYSYLGYYFMLTKDNVKSKEMWTKVKEIDPNNEKAKKALEGIK